MLPDTGERYLSTPLFEDIAAEMSNEELAISASTPRYRFGAPASAPAPAANTEAPLPAPKPAAVDFVDSVIGSREQPIVLFSLEWCEFSWSVRKLFKALDVPYHSIDLDSVAYQQDNWGGEIRVALRERVQAPTIPQIFVGGEHLRRLHGYVRCVQARRLRSCCRPTASPIAAMTGWTRTRCCRSGCTRVDGETMTTDDFDACSNTPAVAHALTSTPPGTGRRARKRRQPRCARRSRFRSPRTAAIHSK
jgi:glutaredoxin